MTPFQQAQKIVSYEARRDLAGNIRLFKLSPKDGGGKYEYAGINDRYHKGELDEVAALVARGAHSAAERRATEYIQKYTDSSARNSKVPAIQFALRDAAFNRGPTGSVKIMQMALSVNPDGIVGVRTRAAMTEAEKHPADFLRKFRKARERYEREVVKRNESSDFWRGLVNRWDNQFTDSVSML